jgi:hypothetical protein
MLTDVDGTGSACPADSAGSASKHSAPTANFAFLIDGNDGEHLFALGTRELQTRP